MLDVLSSFPWVTELTPEFDSRIEQCYVEPDFTPLQELRQLERLNTFDARLSRRELGVINQLASLRSFHRTYRGSGQALSTHPWTVQELRVLLAPSHQLPINESFLRECNSPYTVAHAVARTRVAIGAIQSEQLHRRLPSVSAALHELATHLRLLLMDVLHSNSMDPSPLMPHVTAFGSLRTPELALFDFMTNESHSVQLLTAMPLLTQLILKDVKVSNLSGVASSPALTDLTLIDCQTITFAELCQLS
jgi:hypothetical protein